VDDQNQHTNTTVNSVIDGPDEQPISGLGIDTGPLNGGTEALTLDPSTLGKPPPDGHAAEGLKSRSPFAKIFKRADVVLVLLLVMGMTALLIYGARHKPNQNLASGISSEYSTQTIPLSGFRVDQSGGISFTQSDVTINGILNVQDSLVLAPSVQPNTPTSGQLYFDRNTNQMAYYNGTKFIALTEQGATVQNIGGATGAITLGGGLSIVNNQLTAALPSAGVSSVGGTGGAITVGSGLKMVGSDIQNSGVLSIVPGTPNLVVSNDGNGNVTISSVGGGSGTVTSTGGTTGRIAKFTGVQNVEDSLLSDNGSTVTANGNLAVTGNLVLSTVLPVSSGGTGAATLPNNGVLVGQGTGAFIGVTAPGAGLCLVSTVGAPSFQACGGGGGVTTLNGLSGTLTIANATGSVNTITIDNASASAKGIASFNGTNFTVVGGAVNTVQDISSTSTPTFGGVNTNMISPSAALTVGALSQTLSLLGNASSVFSVSGGGQTTNVGFNGAPTGTVNYNFDRSAPAGTYTICTTVANCAGLGGGVTTSGGTTNRVSKFTGAQTLGDSSISDTGTTVTINGTANLVVQGGTGTFGTLTQAGTLAISDGSSNTISIVTANVAANRTYTLPEAGGNATFCLDTGNCIGAGAGAPNGAAYLLASLDGTLTNERALVNGANIAFTDAGANGSFTVATVQNPTFTTNVTTPTLQSSGALTITSAAGQTVAIDAGTTIELQDSTNVTGSLDVSAAFTAGTANAFQVNSGGAIAAATGITSSGTITLSGLNCTSFANGGALTANASGVLSCSDDDGGAGSGITGTGTTDRISKFTGSQVIGDSSLSDNGTDVTINGTANFVVQGGTTTLGTLTQAGSLVISDGSSNTVSIVTSALSADRIYTLPDAGGNATLCVNSGNCIGGSGSAPNAATYLVASLDGTLTNERALTGGANVSLTDGGANGSMTVATVQNPTFTTSVTTPLLQSSGALTITSAAGNTIAVNAGTTIELQDSTNVTGNLDVSATLTAGTANAFQVNASGAITSAAGITSSGTITFSGLNCTTFANGGSLTTNGSGQLTCSDDDSGAGGTITGSGTSGTIPVFNGTSAITDSIITQSGTTITVAGDLVLNTALSVANGGTGAQTLTSHGVLFGNGTAAVGVTAAGTGGQVLIADASGVPTFATFTGDVAVSNTGATTIQANSVALGTDTTGNYVANLGTLTGLSTTGNTGEGSTPTLNVTYGSIANTAVQGNVTLNCPSGSGNLTGGGTAITLGTGGTCGALSTVNNPTFSTSVTTPSVVLTGAGSNGTIQVGTLGQGTVYTLPDPGAGAATICISTGNCATAGAAGGDLTGTYPNPTIAKLQGTNLTITGPSAGHVLVYNGTNGAWENHALTGDIAISETGLTTVQANSVALGTDTTGNYVLGLTAGNGVNITGTAGEGWSPTVTVVYGSAANTAVQGNTSLTVTAGTNLTGGGATTLGTGGTVTLNVASSPIFSGTLTVQGATATIGTAAQQGSVVLSDGSSNTGTVQTAALGQNTTYTLPDPGAGTATICLTTGNCAGTGTGVTTAGGTTNRVSKFTGPQALGDSTISDNGTLVTINGTANFVVQGGTATLGTLTQSGTLAISDGSSNTVSIVSAALGADRVYTLPDAGGAADFCLSTGNCVGGGAGSAPNSATYLVTSLNGTLTNERAITNGSNIALTDGGANGSFTVATVQNPTFTTSVTTPILQSSGGLTITSAAGTTVAIDAGTTIELQDSTNVTGSLDVSVALNVGTANAFQISSGGAITAATGITSSGTVTFSGLNCTTFANGGTLTTNSSGVVSCADDDGGAGSAITGTGTAGTIPVFSGTNAITNSIITQAGTTVTIAGDLVLNTQLSVANGGTGAQTLTSHGVLFGNGTAAVGVTAAGTGGQVLIADASGVPTFATFSGDVAVSNTGTTTIQADSVALGTDTTGNYVATLGTLTGLGTTGNTGEGSTPTLSVTYGSGANTAVQGNTSLTCASGTGNLSGGGNSVTLGAGGSCNNITISNSPTFSGTLTVQGATTTIGGAAQQGSVVLNDGSANTGTVLTAALGQNTTYTLPDPGGAAATFCLSTGNCAASGTAGGDLTGTYPNPTIAKLQSGTLTITTPTGGNFLMYNGSAWVNQSLTTDVTVSAAGVATIAANAVDSGKIQNSTIVNADLASGSFGNITGVGTLGALTVVGTTNINATGTANTTIGNATGTFQLTSGGGLNVSTAGALTGVTGITTSGGYTQSGATANTLTGATTLSAAGTALSVTNDATIGGVLTANTITPNGALTVGAAAQSFTLQGNGTSTIKSTVTGNTTTVGFASPTANTTLNFPALAAGTYTLCTTSGNCAGVGATLQTAYTNSTATEITLDATRGALTVRDTSGGLGANLLEVQNNAGSTTYFNVTAAGSNTTGTSTASGNINTTGGTVQTNTVDRISNGGNLVNIGTVTTSGAINSQTISSAANFTGTVTIQGSNALTLGVTGTSTGAILFKGATAASGTLTLIAPANPSTNTITLPDATGTVCLQTSSSCGFVIGSGTAFLQNGNSFTATANLGTNDAFDLNIRRGGTTQLTVGNGTVTLASNVDLLMQGATAYISNPQGGGNSESFGLNASVAGGGDSVVIGNAAAGHASGGATVIGASASGSANGTAIGFSSDAQGNGVAVGYNSSANSSGVAIGRDAASGTNSIALGRDATTTASNQLVIGSGVTSEFINNVFIGAGVTSATPTGFTLQATGGSGTNIAGASTTIAGGIGTGNANGGNLNLQVAKPGTTGSSPNTLTTVLSLSGADGSAQFKSTSAVALEVQNASSTPIFTVNTSTPGTVTAGTSSATGNINSSGGAIQTNTVDRISNGGNLVNIGTVTTSGAINSQTISSTANFTGTVTIQGSNALTLGVTGTSTGAALFKGATAASGTITLIGPANPTNNTITLPNATGTVCLQSSASCSFAATTGGTGYIQNQSASQQASSSFWISGNGRIDGTLNANTITGTTGDILIQSATQAISFGGSNYITASGGYTLQSGSNSDLSVMANGSGALNLGTNATSARVINIGATAAQANTSTVNIANSTAAAQTVSIGSTNGTGTTTIAAGSGGITLNGAVTASSTFTGAGLTDCDSTSSKLLWDITTKLFSCGTDKPNVMIRKSSDQQRTSSTVITADTQLTFPIGVGETYIVQIVVNTTEAAAGGFAYTVTAPSGATCNISSLGGDTTGSAGELVNAGCGTVGTYNGGGTSSTEHISATIVNGATANQNVTFAFAQATSNGTATTVKAGSSLLAYKLTGADLAEAYQTKDRTIGPGDIVSADGSLAAGVKKSQGAYDSKVLGIISTNPGTVLGDPTMTPTGMPVLLALSGRIPVKVSTENGPIEAGDYLTPSSTPGVAMKATRPGQMVGKALEAFTGNDSNAPGVVMTFANLTWADPTNGIEANNTLQGATSVSGDLNVSGNTTLSNLTVTGKTTLGQVLINGKIMTGGTAPTVAAQTAAGTGAQATITGNDVAGRIQIKTGSSPSADALAKVTFNSPYVGGTPQVVLTPVGKGSAAAQSYVDDIAADSFLVGASQALLPNTTYTFTYHVIGTAD
jgi:hypothetical protein